MLAIILASRSCTNWNEAIGLPNWMRSCHPTPPAARSAPKQPIFSKRARFRLDSGYVD